MFSPHQNTSSIWQEINPPIYPSLDQNIKTDVCVVGAGIVGVTTAYILLKQGFSVTLLDKDTFGQNETGLTSGHLSNVLDEGYTKLIELHGLEKARQAYQSHTDALELIQKIVNEESIICDLHWLDGYLFENPKQGTDFLEQEMQSLKEVGFQDFELLESPGLFPNCGRAIRYGHQGRIHLLKYLRGLLAAIERMGGRIYMNTRVEKFEEGDSVHVISSAGFAVQAAHVAVCTNVPINNRVQIHSKEASYRSYCIAVDIPPETFPDILLWDCAEPYHYVRKIPSLTKGLDCLLVGGEDHRVGLQSLTEDPYETLHTWLSDKLGIRGEIAQKWSGQIIEPMDGLAYIGKNPGNKNIYICSGDSGHGITHGHIAAMIIRDGIQGRKSPWEKLYSPDRLNFKASGDFLKENLSTAYQYLDLLKLPAEQKSVRDIQPDEGCLVRQGLEPMAVYRDHEGEFHVLSAICPHAGGVVHWNQQEGTWDCPCHGSRFAGTGEVLHGPALEPLEKESLEIIKKEKDERITPVW